MDRKVREGLMGKKLRPYEYLEENSWKMDQKILWGKNFLDALKSEKKDNGGRT